MIKLIALAAALLASSTAAAQTPPVEYHPAPPIAGRPAPFSTAVRVGDVLHLSGQIGIAADGTLPKGFEAQARQTMENIGAVLKARGLGWGDVFKCTVMLENMADWPKFNEIYVPYFPAGKLPARSAFGADGLALGALIELECLAYAGARSAAAVEPLRIMTAGDDGLTQRFTDTFRQAIAPQQRAARPLEILVEQVRPVDDSTSAVIIRYRRADTDLETLRCSFAGNAFERCVNRAAEATARLVRS